MLELLFMRTKFNGIWLDMNEPSNMCNGECSFKKAVQDDYENISYRSEPFKFPYLPGQIPLDHKSLRIKFIR
jgi:alpha-glucosidase/lysosomal alpha-glucosidase